MEYFAFGETFLEEHSNTDRTPYLFNAKELDEETGLYYYGARYYDAKTSVWQSVDPLAEETMTPYQYVNQNPVNMIDPTGMSGEGSEWVPNENGDLISEKNDNAKTLALNYNMTESQAQGLIDSQGLELDSNGNVKENQKLSLDNTYTRSIKNSSGSSDEVTDAYDQYNCFTSCIRGTRGEEIRARNEEEFFNQDGYGYIDGYLSSNTNETNKDNLIFGKTIVRVADKANSSRHAVVYYGKSNNGTKYAYTKDGNYFKPRVTTLSDAVSGYGQIRGMRVQKNIFTKIYEKITGNVSKDTYQSGFYNPK